MKVVDGKNWFSIGEVSQMVGRSKSTINYSWYGAKKLADEEGLHFPFKLPEFRRDLDGKMTRYWDKEGVELLKEFRDNVKSGDLSFFNRTMWGERGVIIQERQDFKDQVEKESGISVEKVMEVKKDGEE